MGTPNLPIRPACLSRAVFGDPAQSPYVLPYPVDMAHRAEMTTTYLKIFYIWHMLLEEELPSFAAVEHQKTTGDRCRKSGNAQPKGRGRSGNPMGISVELVCRFPLKNLKW